MDHGAVATGRLDESRKMRKMIESLRLDQDGGGLVKSGNNGWKALGSMSAFAGYNLTRMLSLMQRLPREGQMRPCPTNRECEGERT
jgi:hypothetical protein